jgi:hypothetical protein
MDWLDDARVVLGAALGAGIVEIVRGRKVLRELDALRTWLRRLAVHVGFEAPPDGRNP